MSSQLPFHHHLLRPAIIHILRAAGFHSTRPSVLDTVTDLAARYLSLLAERTAYFVYERTTLDKLEEDEVAYLPYTRGLDASIPTITDIRQAMSSAGVFSSDTTATEQIWSEILRRPIETYPTAAQEKERRRRDIEDNKDVQQFLDWITGSVNKEIRRIAGLLEEHAPSTQAVVAGTAPVTDLLDPKEDYLTQLKKKRSKTGEDSRFAGTALGRIVNDRGTIRIEGGPESLGAWKESVKRRRLEGNDDGKKKQAAVEAQ